MKILVVDDDPVSRLLLQASLAAAGHRVQEAPDGVVAWNLMQRESFRLVITDWLMPGIDGIELMRRIRSESACGYVYIILLTVRGSKDDIVSGLESGADDYLTKPFNPSELRARVSIGERILDLEARLTDARDQLQRLTTQDGLTNLLNRHAVYAAAEAEIQRSLRSNKPLSLLLLDLDSFHLINERLGHTLGDQALCLVAETLSQSARAYDSVGRWGGEEFLLILPETDAADAEAVATRLQAAIAAVPLASPDDQPIALAASLGIATLDPATPIPLDTLLRQANIALRQAKRSALGQYPKPKRAVRK